MKVRVLVRLKPGVLDVQGKAVEHAIQDLGYSQVSDVRVGRMVELSIEAKDSTEAEKSAEVLCKELLANPIIETYEIQAEL